MSRDTLKGDPTVFDKLRPDLGGKLVKAVADDMERARKEREAKKKKKKKG